MKHIVCFHLYNDYSGSPKVLKMVLEGLLEKGYHVDIVTSRGGVLDELKGREGCCMHCCPYRFSMHPVLTMIRYVFAQTMTFFMALRWAFARNAVFYTNTLLSVGPALAGRLTGKRVVYHYHENAFVKGAFYRILANMMQRLAHKIICVSEYQASFLKHKEKVTVVPNALPKGFVQKLHPDADAAFERKTVLMLSSLKAYKGTKEFIELASRMPEYKFVLVINDKQENIDKYLLDNQIITSPKNLTIYSRQDDVTAFYNAASAVVNLTDKQRAIETFGLTALEAMAAGLPVIVPTAGGIAEMVADGKNGYKIDVVHIDRIAARLKNMLTDKRTYCNMADNALQEAEKYDAEKMNSLITSIINE